MKKFILLTLILIVSGCTKIQTGTYFATLDGKLLNVELLKSDKCILSFSGGEECSGSYHIDGDEIWLIASIEYGKIGRRDYRLYHFTKDGKGKITKNGFTVSCDEVMEKKTHSLSFSAR